MKSDGTFAVCLETIKPQLDHSDPSYRAALDRCQRAAIGETATRQVVHPFGHPWESAGREPVKPDPPYARRSGSPNKRLANRERVIARLIEIGRPATAAEIAQGDEKMRKCVINTRDAGVIVSRPIVFNKALAGKRWQTLYALPSMLWPTLPDGQRYWEKNRKQRSNKKP